MDRIRELSNFAKYAEHGFLDIDTNSTSFYRGDKKIPGFTGFYHCEDYDCLPPPDGTKIFALYPTQAGPIAYYDGKEYAIKPELTVTLSKEGTSGTFRIHEYNLEVSYEEPWCIGFDPWSDEIDVDLFFMIEQCYKTDSFYEKYTL